MAGNPLVDQGVLNRLKGQMTITSFPALNVTASYLDKEGINLRLEGQMTLQHDTMTGRVQSPEPYVPVTMVVALLRTQALANAYKIQWEANSVLGDIMAWLDVSPGGVAPFQFQNMAIQGVGDILINGTTPAFGVSITGTYTVNNNLWN